MKSKILFFGLVLCIGLSSCVPHKNLVYLQNKEKALDSLATNNLTEIQKPYRVQVNDILNIRVKALDQDKVSIYNPVGDESLNADSQERAYFDGFTVDIHGNIRIPVLGEINVLGYTTEEIQKLLENKLLEDQFKETANIFVTVKLAGLRYVTSGEVNSPGTQVLFQDRVNIFEAIANAGEITQTGDRKEVMIIRQYPQGQQIHKLDLTDINVMKSPYYHIQNNDMIYVKPIKQKSWGTGLTGTQTITTLITVMGLVTTSILLIDRL
ncbi:polysaccharide biosynthesis/export family protein [Winogradskyella vincentii]|uniref:Polysaccharide biosynthesis/export family protein n=1 Tax=Winogradskyella vincentii TaxID=2877122 RepID=A0ABS7Y1C6_9FLAO|nr:polysaccharide biosynthesis/export family protein [Winogradskyella vincentii]MCA0153729.1 polysaccharide biosynthesis/export family protein [Winogradskyella vincentii]